MGQKPICTKNDRKWTDQEVNEMCLKTNITIWSVFEVEDCRNERKAEMKLVPDCCPGYKMVNQTWCEDDCKVHCKHGECGDDNRCSCAIGFGGPFCKTACPAGHFGSQCEHNCEWYHLDIQICNVKLRVFDYG